MQNSNRKKDQHTIRLAFISLLLALAAAFGLGGCSMSKDLINSLFPEPEYQGTREEVRQQMIDHLHNKYPDLKFSVFSFEPRQFAHSNYEYMLVAPEGSLPKEYFSVTRYAKDNIVDNYIDYVMSNKYEEMVSKRVKELFPNSRCLAGLTSLITPPQDFMPDMPFEEFVAWGFKDENVSGGARIYVAASDFSQLNKDAVDTIVDELKMYSPSGGITFTGCTQNDIENFKTDGSEGYVKTTEDGKPIYIAERFSETIEWGYEV